MKNMWESSETFTAYATIEAGYYMMIEVDKKRPQRVGIVKAIDTATGYDKKLEYDLAMELVPILEDIIDAKKIIEADYANDEEMLKVSQGIISSYIPQNIK